MLKDIFVNHNDHDLTRGSVVRNIIILAVPMVISHVLNTFLHLVDMFWVGRLGSSAIAAVAMSGAVMMLVMTVIIGLVTGVRALISRFRGAKDNDSADEVARQALLVGLVMGLFLAVTGVLFSEKLFELLRAEPEVIVMGSGYMRILFGGGLVMLLGFLISVILYGAGDAVTPMLIMILTTVVNMIMDPIFIFGYRGVPAMGVNGAALATVLAQAIGCIWGLKVLLTGQSHIHIKFKNMKIDFGLIWRMIKIGVPNSLQMSFRSIMAIVLMGIVAGFGTSAVAAYGIGLRLQMIVLMPAFAVANAASTLVGQNLGALKPRRAFKIAWIATGMDMIVMGLAGIIFFIFAPWLISIFNNQAEVIQMGTVFLRITSLFYIFMAMGIILSRSLNGAGDTVSPMFISLVCLWGVQVPLALFLTRLPSLGLTGVWWAIVISNLLQGTITAVWFSLGRWKNKRV
ncbi:MAG: MATE family efflux transporter [Candidatus Omnitrophica bacterium]|nr:MATE family efflux transporter [Candidatus Omnitrophota bacterium]